MEFSILKRLFADHADCIQILAGGMTAEQARWKPDPDRWSILEVLNHLYDEEREDFRLHLHTILHHPDAAWAPIDPMGWVTSRHYNERDLDISLANFIAERQQSLVWLASLQSPDWEQSVPAPWGEIKAGDIFASWVVHDEWHMQQLVRLRRDVTTQLARPYNVKYAGTL